MSGFFEIGIFHTKTEMNIGTLMRSAYQLGAVGVFTIGRRYSCEASDTCCTPRNVPLRHYIDFEDFNKHRPHDALLIGIEIGGIPLRAFSHPKRCVYLLGAEDHGLPEEILEHCQQIVSLEAVRMPSFNVAVAGSLVMYDRMFSGKRQGVIPCKTPV